jgi:hypothetical protein
MPVKGSLSSQKISRTTESKRDPAPLKESDQSAIHEKVDTLSKAAADLRSKISDLEMQYERQSITARQHDKQVKKYLVELFDINRQLLPLKEKIQNDAEEKERTRIREKLEAMGVKQGKKASPKKQKATKKAKPARTKRRRAAS